ncbi:MAG: succinylglutamate desuccinylase/aspartoacylase family protein [Candidatus Sumerlaeia bacterium]
MTPKTEPASDNEQPDPPTPLKPAKLLKYSFLNILTGSDLSKRRLGLMEARGLKPGPVLWLTACIHGDEVGGMVVIHEIFRRLRQRPLVRGRLLALPLMNPLGYETHSRQVAMSQEDLNRVFPGHPKGSLAERLAHLIFNLIIESGAAAVLDLHNDWRGSIPYAVLDPPLRGEPPDLDAAVAALARATGLPMVREQLGGLDSIPVEKTLAGSLRMRGVPALTLELGEANVVNERDVHNGVAVVWNVLRHLGMADDAPPALSLTIPEAARGRELFYSHQPVSSSTGVIRFLAATGTLVKAGQKFARIFNAFGKTVETLCAPAEGLVLGRSDSSVAHPGSPVMAFGLLERPPLDSPAAPAGKENAGARQRRSVKPE